MQLSGSVYWACALLFAALVSWSLLSHLSAIHYMYMYVPVGKLSSSCMLPFGELLRVRKENEHLVLLSLAHKCNCKVAWELYYMCECVDIL